MIRNVTRSAFQGYNCACVLRTRHASTKDIVKKMDYPVKTPPAAAPPTVVSLENELRVACFANDSELSSTAIHVEVGTRNEGPGQNGVSNFIARLVGQGTSNQNQKDLQNRLSEMGATLDVHVNREYTSFAVTGFSKDAVEHAQILSDVVKNAIYDENAIETERKKILEHLDKQQDNVPIVTMDYLYSVAYEGTPLGNPLLGSSSNIESIGRKEILSFLENNYKAPRMLLTSVGGNTDLEKLATAAQTNLIDVSTKYSGSAEYLKPCRFTALEVQHRDDALPLAHIAMGFNGCSYNSPDRPALMLIAEMVGSHDKTHGALSQGLHPIAQHVQNPQYESYSARSFAHFYSDCGMSGFYFVAGPPTIDAAGGFMARFYMNLCHNVSETALLRAKRSLKRKLIEEMYDMQALQDKLAQDIFFGAGKPQPLEEVLAQIESLSPKDIQSVATDYFHDQDFARSAYGPTEAVTDYNRMKSNFHWP